MKNSFQPFYETTLLEGRTDFNRVYDLRTKIKPFLLYNFEDVERYYEFMSKHSGSKQSAVDMGRLCALLKPIIDRYEDISIEEDKFNCRMAIRSFVKCYA